MAADDGGYKISAAAVGKAVLHAAKHAHGEVCGALLGSQDPATSAVLIADAVPFFHKQENKHSPLMEVALAQVRSDLDLRAHAKRKPRSRVPFH